MNIQSAPTLEPGIYWNAELAWLMGYMAQNAGSKRDCNGDISGAAFLDQCLVCVGGNTGQTACIPSSSKNIQNNEPDLKIFPNPAKGTFRIQGASSNHWQVFNAVSIPLFSGNDNTIDLTDYTSGLYFLKIRNKVYKLLNE
jgi:Secretion system C-terminal sorting domain